MMGTSTIICCRETCHCHIQGFHALVAPHQCLGLILISNWKVAKIGWISPSTHLRVSATPTSCFFLSALLWLLTTLPANVSWNYIRPRSPPFYLASSHYLFFKIQLKHDLAIYYYYITLPVLLYCSGVQNYVLFVFVYSVLKSAWYIVCFQ